jgi:tRNA (cytidine56-2'-O)-methyltransferase
LAQQQQEEEQKAKDQDDKIGITVLRLGHRLVRDTRTSTHVALVARALGAKEIVMSGAPEEDTIESLKRINARWGGSFAVSENPRGLQFLKAWKGVSVHLTMYGEPLEEALPKIRRKLDSEDGGNRKELLVVVGAEKVPRQVYSLSNFNVAVGNQPHSEVAALGIFLDRIYKGKELYFHFGNARMRIIPSEREKKVKVNQLES